MASDAVDEGPRGAGGLTADPGGSGGPGAVLGQLRQLFTSRDHPRDFTATQAEAIRSRLAVVQLLFAAGFLAWIPFDYVLLAGHEAVTTIMVARLVLAVGLIALWLFTRRATSGRATSVLVGATLLAVSLFYAASMIILDAADVGELIGGYRALPFVLIVLTALFPATLLTGVALVGMLLALFVVVELVLGTLATVQSLNTLWMLVLVSGIVVWVQAGQLALLLRLYAESAYDPVTGLFSRRVLRRAAQREIERGQAQGRSMAVFALELGSLGDIRIAHGQQASDAILRRTADVFVRHLGQGALLGRHEGQMLVGLLKDRDGMGALVVAEQIQSELARTPFRLPDGDTVRLQPRAAVTEIGADDRYDDAIDRVSRARLDQARDDRAPVVHC